MSLEGLQTHSSAERVAEMSMQESGRPAASGPKEGSLGCWPFVVMGGDPQNLGCRKQDGSKFTRPHGQGSAP